jgi:hypothetical protein
MWYRARYSSLSRGVLYDVQLEGYQYSCSQNRMRMRMFNVLDDVKRQHGFCPIITRPAGKIRLTLRTCQPAPGTRLSS